mmetsp:Transcript_20360/g.29442  ORF Transcript_20360/g.29442 Transcript_20360/m.29442 type:complete len:318 (-) Transcript_20360:1087-2040(-)|eukprot:CAMPEP_0202469898 /NCGR_PEP_ID=MMETSP1360-20130828/79857_1 /ASSEMBLY_ACC=CAM_ASM_000848 /TAXON_ID=515479 /ORGANISM="Licmophora paradoxa, Strain CCMP2313" /LENGTH=317 /DNA_ID=CAMNT_0049095397 /DNA_START=28 /DNA_END=981 /DNA_ORIENTATION=-
MADKRVYAGNSPALSPYEGTFSEEEIHEILSGINNDNNTVATNQTHAAADEGVAASGIVVSTSSDNIHPEVKAAARSERKRSREKQRRSDVNKHFADLTALLRKIESEGEDGTTRLRQTTTPPTNRVDLLNRTISVLETVHRENKAKKVEITDLKRKLDEANKMAEDTAARLKEATLYQHPAMQKQVMMMVPMMMPQSDGMQTNPAAAAYPVQAPMMMPQQMIMMPQPPQPSAAPAPNGMMPVMPVQPQQQSPVTHMMYQRSPSGASLSQSNSVHQQTAATQQSLQNQETRRQQSHQGQRKDDTSQNVTVGNLAHCA